MDYIGTVLFVDDEPDVRRANAQTLDLAGFEVRLASSGECALRSLDDSVHVVVTDVKMSGMDGIQLLRRLCEFDVDLPVILITAHGDVPMAVDAMRAGAYDFVQKPYAADRLVESVRRAIEKRDLILENRRLRSRLEGMALENRLVGTSRGIADVRRSVMELGPTAANVIVRGETGTGKEIVARCLHDIGTRAQGPFVAINCGAIPETMFESELFGHESGAFTGAASRRIGKLEFAKGGTVFLDEVESMPVTAQVKILRAIEERSIERLGSNRSVPLDIRIIAATQTDLLDAVKKGLFRPDLYYRLAVAEIAVPPLRLRPEDIPLLFDLFASQAAATHGTQYKTIDPQDLGVLLAHDWPGNVRELRNVAARFVLGVGRPPLERLVASLATFDSLSRPRGPALVQQLEEFERRLIISALERSNGDICVAMNILQLPRRTLNEKMQRHGIDRHGFLPTISRDG